MDFKNQYKEQLNEYGQFKDYNDYLQYIYITFKDEIMVQAKKLAEEKGVKAVIDCLKGFKLFDGKQVVKIENLHPKNYLEFLDRLKNYK